MPKKAVIFDLDGTLIDSLKDIAICANIVLEEFNLPTHKLEDYKYFVGGGVLFLLENCTPQNTSKELIRKLFDRFKEVYEQNLHDQTKPYEGINSLLEELQKKEIKMGILSNKMHDMTLKYYERFFSKYNIQEVHGQKEHIPKKPNPQGAVIIAQNMGLECKDIYFVGDSDVDIKTAKNAGMIAVGVSWGFRGTKELIEHGADYIVQTPQDILKLLK